MTTLRAAAGAVVLLGLSLTLGGCGPGMDGFGRSESPLTSCPTQTVEGIDIYDGSGTVDWVKVKSQGIQFVNIKATQGTYNTQANFRSYWAGAKAAGLYRGAYHFLDPTQNGVAQARYFLAAVGPLAPDDLPPTVDLECPDGNATCLGFPGGSGQVSAAVLRQVLEDFLTTVKAATGKTPIIYTYGYFLTRNALDTTGLQAYSLWDANYTTNGCFSVPAPWTSAKLWQYGITSLPGVQNPSVDRDRFLGTLQDLQRFALGTTAPYAATFVAQSWPFATSTIQLTAGQELAARLTLKNTGSAPWTSSTRLGTTVARDRPSPFVGPGWLSPSRLAAVTGTVAPGASFDFSFTWKAPEVPGMYDEHYGLVQEGVAWFGDAAQGGPSDAILEAKFVVVPAPDAGRPPSPDGGHPAVDGGTVFPDGGATAGDGGASPSPSPSSPGPTPLPPRPGGAGSGGHVSGGNGCMAFPLTPGLGLLVLLLPLTRRRRSRVAPLRRG